MLVTIAEAIAHCRADTQDDVEPYLLAGIDQAVQFLNRQVYEDSAALEAAIVALPVALADAQTAYDAAKVAAQSLDSTLARERALRAACESLESSRYLSDRVYAGIVVNPSIRAAILLMTGHLFRNREAVTAESTNEMPLGFRELLIPHRISWGV